MSTKRWLVIGLAVVVVVALGALALAVLRGRPPEEVSVDEAVEQYRTTAPPTTAAARADRPTPGVYTATGSGREKLSFQTSEQPIGPTLPVTVTLEGSDCFLLRVDFNANHWQSWTYCDRDGELVDLGGQVFQRFDLVVVTPESLSTSVCDPPAVVVRPGMVEGDTWDQSCVITSSETGESTTTGPHLYVGPEVLTIGGAPVDTHHVRDQRTYGGNQEGSGTTDLWIDIRTGLPVRMMWSLRIDSPSPIGSVTYTEEGTWTLDSLVPRSA
jgi:hypothetical protein